GGRHEHVPGAVATLLLDELAEHNRHAALHRLEGLAREALVGFTQPPAQRDHQARGDLGVPAEQPPHVWTQQATHAQRLDRFDRRRALLVLEQRQLAEDVARPEPRQGDPAPVAVRAPPPPPPLSHPLPPPPAPAPPPPP